MGLNEIHISEHTLNLLFKIVISLILGLIIGLEREHRAKEEAFAGIRTFPLIAILGCLSAFIYDNYWNSIMWLTFGAVIVFSIVNFYLEYQKDKGITTEIAVILTFVVGFLIYFNYIYIGVFLTIAITVLLALKNYLETFAKKLSQEDIFAILKFILITIVVYPLLPDKNFGPLNALNLKDIWKVIIIVSSLDFIGYIILKWKGSKALWINGIVGGLVSSTAVTYNLAKKAKAYPVLTSSAAFGISLAWTVMNFRVLFLAFIVNKNMAIALLEPMLLSSFFFLIFIYVKYKNEFFSNEKSNTDIKINNPFELLSAFQFGFIYALVVVMIKLLNFYIGEKGVYLASFISGVIDVDAITLSLSQMAAQSKVLDLYKDGILLAVISNSLFKFLYALIFGNRQLAKDIFVLLVIITAVCGVYIFL